MWILKEHNGCLCSTVTVTATPTASVNGRNETRSADESWRSAGKKRRPRSSASYGRERRRKTSKGKKIRVKKREQVTTAVAQTRVSMNTRWRSPRNPLQPRSLRLRTLILHRQPRYRRLRNNDVLHFAFLQSNGTPQVTRGHWHMGLLVLFLPQKANKSSKRPDNQKKARVKKERERKNRKEKEIREKKSRRSEEMSRVRWVHTGWKEYVYGYGEAELIGGASLKCNVHRSQIHPPLSLPLSQV